MAQKSAPRSEPGGDDSSGVVSLAQVAAWFEAHVPSDWFTGPLRVDADRDEVVITGVIEDVVLPEGPGALSAQDHRTMVAARIISFREATRTQRVAIAARVEASLGRKVSWAVECNGYRETFTNVSAPVMTRLRFAERQVLDTLVDASVARTRSEALAWCVRLVGQHQDDWIRELRDAMVHVEQVRAKGPRA